MSSGELEQRMGAVKSALSRLSGCELNHLTPMEAKVIQAFRNHGYKEGDYIQLFLLLIEGGSKATALRELLNQEKG